jgi:hypothetical protein
MWRGLLEGESSEMNCMAEEDFTDKRHLVLDEFVEEKKELLK